MRSVALLVLMMVARLSAAFHFPSMHSTAGMARWLHVRRTPVALTFNPRVSHVYHQDHMCDHQHPCTSYVYHRA